MTDIRAIASPEGRRTDPFPGEAAESVAGRSRGHSAAAEQPRWHGRATFVFLSTRDLGRAAAQENPDVPSHVYYGLREMAGLGVEAAAVFPSPKPTRVVRWCSSAASKIVGCPVYFGALMGVARTRGTEEVVVNTTMMHGFAWSLLRVAGLAHTPQVMVSVGHEFLPPLDSIAGRLRLGLLRLLFRKIEAVVSFCPVEADQIRRVVQPARTWVGAIPQGIDLGFYPDAIGAEDTPPYIASIGADAQRDFVALAEIARRMPRQRFVVVSTAKHLRRVEFPANVDVHQEMPQAQTREIFRRCAAMLITTRPSSYISGLTTILISSAMGKPVAFDNAAKGAVYGLRAWENCVTFPRGDPAAAVAALEKLMADATLRRDLGHAAQRFARAHPISRWAERLKVVVEHVGAGRTPPPIVWPHDVRVGATPS